MIDLTNKPELRISNTDLSKSSREGCKYVIFKKPYKDGNICFCEMEFTELLEKHAPQGLENDINRFYENSLRIYSQFTN